MSAFVLGMHLKKRLGAKIRGENMQRCKYLDDIGLKVCEYGTNFVRVDDTRMVDWAAERAIYGFDSRETWNLEVMFIEWIYTRVSMYKEKAGYMINTDVHNIKYRDKQITQGDAMDLILELAKAILLDIDNCELFLKNSQEICDLWKEVLPYMWW